MTAAARVFFSGHSLTDRPLPDHFERIAQSLGTPVLWNRQYVVGSSIRRRVQGDDPLAQDYRGYRQGYNRDTEGLDVVAEFRAPQTTDGRPYDTLVITEQHGLLGTLLWNDTVRYLRHYHDRFIDGNPQGKTFFYESWISLDDKSDPRRWIAYERAASPIWHCIAERVNLSLAAQGRRDRITPLPMGLALAQLIEDSLAPSGPSALKAATTLETVSQFIGDEVHLGPLGMYYAALVTYAARFGRSPVGAWAPEGVRPDQAQVLQDHAWAFVNDYYSHLRPRTMAQCQSLIRDDFAWRYWSYIRDAYWRREMNVVMAYAKWVRHYAEWRYKLSRQDERNPFHYDPRSDSGYWLP
ncbi:hypothetical protein [Caldimonas caldifontis]|uniref:Uncharacterized protein n=1 Tax=Caldimonas caldifontis TaxID=1452508 RepID=A0A2S5SS39_9BURK|nr:hypothetical protein [Caldimonas caldifontis]PPE65552.1 hypothetical protein C1704_14095 [Caldimonas caldifontis]